MSLLRDRRISALLGAEVISSLGTQMTWLALPWFVLRTTGSPQQMTWVIIAEVLPIGVLGFWGGAIAARVGTRRTMLACDLARAPLLAAIPILHSVDLLPFPVLLALVAATGAFIAPYFAVQRAVVPEHVGEEQGDVAYATAFFQAANRLTIFLGPPAAGVLIAVLGAAQILYVDAATYVISFALVAAFVHPPEVPAPEEAAGFFMSLVNAPIQALVMLRIPRELRTQGIAAFGVFQCIAAPLGLLAAGFALARYDTHSVLTVVLTLQSVAVLTIVTTALAERSALGSAAVDSPA